MEIGIKIKNLRNEKDMTLKELSEKSQLSIGFLSQLERGRTTIAVDALERMAEIFEVPLTYFFELPNRRTNKILRSYEMEVFNVEEGGYIHYLLSSDLEDKSFVPRYVEILPQKKDEEIVPYKHEGEEFAYILEGVLTAYIDGEQFELYPGDSLHINSNVDHNWANYTSKKVKLLSVNAPNFFNKDILDTMEKK